MSYRKVCVKCQKEKPESDFYMLRTGKRHTYCSTCSVQLSVVYKRKKREDHPEFEMLAAARRRAKKRGTPYSLKLGDVTIPSHCHILGIPLQKGIGRGNILAGSPSLDEIIPGKGYILGNVQVISNKANAMKSNASLEELVQMGNWAKALLDKNNRTAVQ